MPYAFTRGKRDPMVVADRSASAFMAADDFGVLVGACILAVRLMWVKGLFGGTATGEC